MHIDLMFPNKYLKAADFQGRDIKLTITKIQNEQLKQTDGGKKQSWVVYFAETAESAKKNKTEEKRFCMNKTNAKAIAEKLGNDADKWVGKQITLYPTTCKAFGKVVECIRVR